MFKSNSAMCQGYCGSMNFTKEDELKMLDLEEKNLEQRLEFVRRAKESAAKEETVSSAEKE